MDLMLLLTLVGVALVVVGAAALAGPWALVASGAVLAAVGLLVDGPGGA